MTPARRSAIAPTPRATPLDGSRSSAELAARASFPRTGAHQADVAWAARIRFVAEARLEDYGSGLAPVTDGWFVVNVRDAEWWFAESRGAACNFESEYGEP